MSEYGILAAYDGSASGYDALRWSAREAWDRRTRLTVLLASDLAPPGQWLPRDAARRAADRGERLGSVALAMLHYSPCPLAIVKPR